MGYVVSGKKRRELKNKRFQIKRFVDNFWHYHTFNKDMCEFLKCENLYSDEEAQKLFDKNKQELQEIERRLNETTEVC